jgi:hypothetical protein
MFDDLLNLTQSSSLEFAKNLSSWNHNIFVSLILIEFLIISATYILKPEQIEQLPIKLALLGITAGIGGVLFMYLPDIWVMGWKTVQYIVKESSGSSTTITPSPSDFLNQAFSIVGHLFASATENAGWNPFQFMGNILVSVVIAFGVFGLFVIIIITLVGNFMMWSVLGAVGGIFVVMYVVKSTRPCFQSYIKYMCGLLLKTLGLFLMVSMLSVYLHTFTSYDSKIGKAPSTADCQQVIDIQEQLQNCTDTQCKIDLTPSLNSAKKLCSEEKLEYNAWQIQASHGFIERGLILMLVLFIFVTMIKTIPNVLASLVGFGDYSIHGMGQAMGAVAMGAGAAKLLLQSNPVQAAGRAVAQTAAGLAGGLAGAATSSLGKVAGGLANKQGDSGISSFLRSTGKGMQHTGEAAKKAGSHIGDGAQKVGSKAVEAAKWAGGSKDEESAKAGRRKLVDEVTKQFKNHK